MQQATERTREIVPLNGVDTPTLLATINAVKAQPELAQFQFRATQRWIAGTHSEGRFRAFHGAGAEHEHKTPVTFDIDHPPVLTGKDNGPTPVEYLLIGLAGCIMAGIGNIAAARGVTLESVTATVEGDIDLQGILGLSQTVRNGYQAIRIHFDIKGDAPADKLRAIVEQGRARSAVYDVLTAGTPIEMSVSAG